MEAAKHEICAICQEGLKIDHISSSCDHSFCLKCYPYLLFNLIKSIGIRAEFFGNPQNEYLCLICGSGKIKFPYESLFKEFKENPSFGKEKAKKLCDGCKEKHAEIFCTECLRIFCDECLEQTHKPKMFQSHKISNLEHMESLKEVSTAEKFQCSCSAKHFLTNFCLKCQIAICSYCLKSQHEGHDQISLEKAMLNESKSKAIEKKIESLHQNYSFFKKEFLKKVENSRNIYKDKFNAIIEEIIKELKSLKDLNEKKSSEECQILSFQLQLIQSSLLLMKQELQQYHSNLHPNKKFHIMKLLDDIEESQMARDTDWEANYEENLESMIEMKDMVLKIQNKYLSQNHRLMKLDGYYEIKFRKILDFDNFQTNPVELLKEPNTIVEEKSLNCRFFKSQVSCSYLLNEESFLVWAGYIKDNLGKKTYPLMVYNLSQNKKETLLQKDNKDQITLVDYYPKDDRDFQKKWLYCADDGGILRIYKILANKSFKLKSQIETNLGKAILSAMIFKDQFNELDANSEDELSNCYIMMTLYEGSPPPILLYKKIRDCNTNEDKWELFRKIATPYDNKNCFTLNFYEDEIDRKTRFFFGFSSSYIGIYDLKANSWEKTDFETENRVNCIKFLFRNINSNKSTSLNESENKIEPFLIYCLNTNNLIIGNIKTRKIVRKIEINNVSHIYDCCIWNSSSNNYNKQLYLLVATAGSSSSIQILDFDNSNLLFMKNLEKFAVNLTKVKKVGEKNYKECLASFLGDGDSSQIVVLEREKN